jgi:hypothetical protein
MLMRKLLASFLLLCLGVLVPVAASPMRVCLLDGGIFAASCATEVGCCDCDGSHEPCCVELEKLPTLSVPQAELELPPALLAELPSWICPQPLASERSREISRYSEPIRGPDSPAARRAVLEIWRL